MTLKDPRRFIVTEIVHTQGVMLICLDCSNTITNSVSYVVHEWRNDAAGFDQLTYYAAMHEEDHH